MTNGKDRPTRQPKDWDAFAKEWSADLAANKNRRLRSERRVATTREYLVAKGALTPQDRVLDIGCGFGKFSVEFGRYSRQVVGTDVSQEMARLGQEHARESGVGNVDFEVLDFGTADLGALGWEGAFDLAFASITPAISSIDDLCRMMRTSRRHCYLSTFVHAETPLEDRACRELFGVEPQGRRRGEGFKEMLDALWGWGYFPEVTYYHEPVDDLKAPTRSMAENIARRYAGSEDPDDVGRAWGWLRGLADADGLIRYQSDWVYGWLLWDVTRRAERVDVGP